MCHSHIHGTPNTAHSVLPPHRHPRCPLSWMATASLTSSLSSGPNSGVTSSWPFPPIAFFCHCPLPLLVLVGGDFSAHFSLVVSTIPVALATTSAPALKPNTQASSPQSSDSGGGREVCGLFPGTRRQHLWGSFMYLIFYMPRSRFVMYPPAP